MLFTPTLSPYTNIPESFTLLPKSLPLESIPYAPDAVGHHSLTFSSFPGQHLSQLYPVTICVIVFSPDYKLLWSTDLKGINE